MSNRPRYHMLDTWRGIAALAVVLHHTPVYALEFGNDSYAEALLLAAYRIGWWGVPLFFTISGYCILASASHSQSAVAFTRRRLRRIFPPYYASIILVALLWPLLEPLWAVYPYSIPNPLHFTEWQWVANLTLTGAWLWRVVHESTTLCLGPAWTLCYELGYYLMVAGILAVAGRRWLAPGLVFIGAMCVMLGDHVMLTRTPGDFYLLAFCAGAAAYFYFEVEDRLARATIVTSQVAIALYVASSSQPELLARHSSPEAGAIIGIAFALLLIALSPSDETVSSWKIVQPLRWCGIRCYSIYLMHWPVCKACRTLFDRDGISEWVVWWPLVTVPLSLLVGHLFYIVVEQHFIGQRAAKENHVVAPAQRTPVREIA